MRRLGMYDADEIEKMKSENEDLKRENFELKTLLYRHRRAITTIHGIANDMMDKIREKGPQ